MNTVIAKLTMGLIILVANIAMAKSNIVTTKCHIIAVRGNHLDVNCEGFPGNPESSLKGSFLQGPPEYSKLFQQSINKDVLVTIEISQDIDDKSFLYGAVILKFGDTDILYHQNADAIIVYSPTSHAGLRTNKLLTSEKGPRVSEDAYSRRCNKSTPSYKARELVYRSTESNITISDIGDFLVGFDGCSHMGAYTRFDLQIPNVASNVKQLQLSPRIAKIVTSIFGVKNIDTELADKATVDSINCTAVDNCIVNFTDWMQ